METPPPSKIGQDKDRISTLPDEILLGILERLSLRETVRAGAVSTRWRHLPHQLSRLCLDVGNFHGTTLLETMDAFMGATQRLLSPTECKCDCKSRRSVKILRLRFYPSAHHLGSICHAVEDTVSRGETDRFEFELVQPSSNLIAPGQQAVSRTELGTQFMSFSRACPIAFWWLTGLSLTSLEFGDSDLTSLIGACDKLKQLSLRHCRSVGHSVLKIDVPNSIIHRLVFIRIRCMRIELVSVPKLTRLFYRSWRFQNPPLHFGHVPELHEVSLSSHAKVWQSPFALSECFSMNARNLSKLFLHFNCQKIWIRLEHPKQLTAIFSSLTAVTLWRIFPECDLSWTLFILEAAPALQMFMLNRARHCCIKMSKDSAEKTNVVWEPSKDLKHLNLKLLVMIGFEEENKVINYIRLVMERATDLKRIMLCGRTCDACNAIDLEAPTRSKADKASSYRIKEQLTHGSSSSVKITVRKRLINSKNPMNEVLKAVSLSDNV